MKNDTATTAPSRLEMAMLCAWCGTKYGQKPGHGQTGPSHGICARCYAELMAKGMEPLDDEE